MRVRGAFARARADAGFTLIELLVSIVILGIVTGAVTSAIITGLRTTDDTSQRLAESRDAQLVQVYLPNDVQSATDASTTDISCGGVTPVVRLKWTDAGVTKIAAYVIQMAGSERQLVRKYCENGTQVVSYPVARHLGSTPPTVTCVPSCGAGFARLTLNATDEGGYSYSVTAARRAS